jgi:hypothetical protein
MPALAVSKSVADIGEAGRQGAGTRAETHVARVVPVSVAAHLMVQRGRRLARCRVAAVTAVDVRSPAEREGRIVSTTLIQSSLAFRLDSVTAATGLWIRRIGKPMKAVGADIPAPQAAVSSELAT